MSGKIEDLARHRAERDRQNAGESERAQATAAQCPICGRPRSDAHRPFCSKRCAEIDLGRWLKESYRVPGADAPSDEDRPAGPDED